MLHFELTTPERIVVRDEIESLTAPTEVGEVTILPKHIPYVVPLVAGIVQIKKARGEEEEVAVHGGFLEVKPDDVHGTRVILLADAAERAEEIDMERAEEARKRAKKEREQYRNVDEVKFAEAAAAFERAFTRVKLAKRRRKRRS